MDFKQRWQARKYRWKGEWNRPIPTKEACLFAFIMFLAGCMVTFMVVSIIGGGGH